MPDDDDSVLVINIGELTGVTAADIEEQPSENRSTTLPDGAVQLTVEGEEVAGDASAELDLESLLSDSTVQPSSGSAGNITIPQGASRPSAQGSSVPDIQPRAEAVSQSPENRAVLDNTSAKLESPSSRDESAAPQPSSASDAQPNAGAVAQGAESRAASGEASAQPGTPSSRDESVAHQSSSASDAQPNAEAVAQGAETRAASDNAKAQPNATNVRGENTAPQVTAQQTAGEKEIAQNVVMPDVQGAEHPVAPAQPNLAHTISSAQESSLALPPDGVIQLSLEGEELASGKDPQLDALLAAALGKGGGITLKRSGRSEIATTNGIPKLKMPSLDLSISVTEKGTEVTPLPTPLTEHLEGDIEGMSDEEQEEILEESTASEDQESPADESAPPPTDDDEDDLEDADEDSEDEEEDTDDADEDSDSDDGDEDSEDDDGEDSDDEDDEDADGDEDTNDSDEDSDADEDSDDDEDSADEDSSEDDASDGEDKGSEDDSGDADEPEDTVEPSAVAVPEEELESAATEGVDPEFAEKIAKTVSQDTEAPQAKELSMPEAKNLKTPAVDYQQPETNPLKPQPVPHVPARGAIPVESMPVTVTFEVGRNKVTVGELERLKEGYTFECGNPMESPVTICANDTPIGVGELVDVEGRIGVRVIKFYSK